MGRTVEVLVLVVSLSVLAVLGVRACLRRPAPGPAAGQAERVANTAPAERAAEARPALRFLAAELPFQYQRGDSGMAWPLEPTGGGVAIADFDADGRPDLFFAQGLPLPPGRTSPTEGDVLLRNLGRRRFADRSCQAGLACKGYGLGATVADYDEDGFLDVYVTRYGTNTLWHNEGDGRFTDLTAAASVGCRLWSLGAAFADFDGDRDLDLYVANYLEFDPAQAPFARDPVTGAPDYGLPESFRGLPDVLYRNDGDGRFADVTGSSGITGRMRGMGVLATDFDGDGRMDIFVANDAQTNTLWHNQGDGRFHDVAMEWGVAVNAAGETEANMGIAYGDTDGDGRQDLLVSHYFNEHDTLWRATGYVGGQAGFQDETYAAGLGLASRKMTGWGTALADFDHDGLLDLVVVNGHIRREPNQPYHYRNPPLLWRGRADGRFDNVTAGAGPYFRRLHQARGLAAGDLDGDGDLDLVVVHHYEPAAVLWNESARRGHRLLVELIGRDSNRTAIGTRLTAWTAAGRLVRTLDGGGSYISWSHRRIHFGLGTAPAVQRLQLRWPSGQMQQWESLPADTALVLREGLQRWRRAPPQP